MNIGDRVYHHTYGYGYVSYVSSDPDNPVITIMLPNIGLISNTLQNCLSVGWGIV